MINEPVETFRPRETKLQIVEEAVVKKKRKEKPTPLDPKTMLITNSMDELRA